jgi:hypothetical protein
MTIQRTLKREARVALSIRAQPVWFRILKWIVILVGGTWLWRTSYFWPVLTVAAVLAVGLHLMWRWKTRNWTQPWGGWDDIEAGRERDDG